MKKCKILYLSVIFSSGLALPGCGSFGHSSRVMIASPPSWAMENCAPTEAGYVFTGYGFGKSVGAASREALIDAKKNALLCIIGGQFSYYFESTQTYDSKKGESQSVEASTRVSLNIDDLDWSGFAKILGKHWTAKKEGEGIELYGQYRWPEVKMKASRAHLDLLVAEIEKNRALEKQAEAKDRLIQAQKRQVKELKQKSAELERLKLESKKKATELAALKKKLPLLEKKAQGYDSMASRYQELMAVVQKQNTAIAEQR